MSLSRATAGSVLFFFVAPGTVAALIPWLITGWEPGPDGGSPVALRVVGGLLILAGLAGLVASFVKFVIDGRGTPAPAAAPQRLVVTGLYRFTRNPMYLAVVSIILGQAVLLVRPVLLGYAAIVFLTVYLFVRLHEEPALERQFGESYRRYRRDVPGWWLRLTGCELPSAGSEERQRR